jgi:hypothetical protein
VSVLESSNRLLAISAQERIARASAQLSQRVKSLKIEIRKAVEAVPERYRVLFSKTASLEASPRQAIKAKCLECCCFEEIQERIGNCTTYRCPLWAYRPYQDKTEEGEE